MDIIKDWDKIRLHFSKSFATSMHVSIASVTDEGMPTVTPIGSLFLNQDQTGFYFEKFPSNLPSNVETNKNICILAVNSGKIFWLQSLYKSKFATYPSIKLYGTIGKKRIATKTEIRALNRRMKRTKNLKGHQYLWSEMKYVREINFTSGEGTKLGKMTEEL